MKGFHRAACWVTVVNVLLKSSLPGSALSYLSRPGGGEKVWQAMAGGGRETVKVQGVGKDPL